MQRTKTWPEVLKNAQFLKFISKTCEKTCSSQWDEKTDRFVLRSYVCSSMKSHWIFGSYTTVKTHKTLQKRMIFFAEKQFENMSQWNWRLVCDITETYQINCLNCWKIAALQADWNYCRRGPKSFVDFQIPFARNSRKVVGQQLQTLMW